MVNINFKDFDEAVQNNLEETTLNLTERIRATTPVDTGIMKKTLTAVDKTKIYANTHYAQYNETGTRFTQKNKGWFSRPIQIYGRGEVDKWMKS